MAATVRLLDLDGTLVLTYPVYARCLSTGDGPSEEEITQALLRGQSVVRLAEASGVSKARFARLLRGETLAPVQGWPETLDELRARGHPIGVVTSLPGWLALPLLAAVDVERHVNVVVHAGICRVPKPSPKPLLAAFQLLDRTPAPDDLYVGDSVADEKAAAAAGIGFVWAAWGYGTPSAGSMRLTTPAGALAL